MYQNLKGNHLILQDNILTKNFNFNMKGFSPSLFAKKKISESKATL